MDLTLAEGEAVGIVGESGSGKSTMANALMRLLPSNGRVVRGEITFQGSSLLGASDREMRRIRGGRIALVSQDPMTALNPVMTIGRQIAETIRAHTGADRGQATRRSVELLDLVRIPDPSAAAKAYPHQLSGGQRQRAAIAMAVSCSPTLLIADEPTTALDVSIQDQILRLLGRLRRTLGMAMIVVSHNLGVVSALTDTIVIMYRSYPVETGPTRSVLADPRHPYTLGLVGAIPELKDVARRRLRSIEGVQIPLTGDAAACPFVDRCDYAEDRCQHGVPAALEVGPGRLAACVRATEALASAGTEGGRP
jgi:oligopeptide/dipeptide ABC transporter ATP-binding protein